MTRRTLKIVAVGYLVKVVLLAAAWIAIPDLPQRAAKQARKAWSVIVSDKTDSQESAEAR